MFSNPENNLKSLGITHGSIVADFGTGTGFYALAAARMVSPGGRVYAVDVQKDLLERLKNNASREGLHDVLVVWGDIEKLGGTHIKNHAVDAVIISNVLFQAEDKEGVIKEAERILKPKGKVLFIDWKDVSSIGGPLPASLLSEEQSRALFEKAGFEFEMSVDAGAHHYGMVFIKT